MADEQADVVEARDNAADLTGGLVMTTTVLLLLAIYVVLTALKEYFGVGMLA